MKDLTLKKSSSREQLKSLSPMDNIEENSVYFGDDTNISTQIITNSHYRPRKD